AKEKVQKTALRSSATGGEDGNGEDSDGGSDAGSDTDSDAGSEQSAEAGEAEVRPSLADTDQIERRRTASPLKLQDLLEGLGMPSPLIGVTGLGTAMWPGATARAAPATPGAAVRSWSSAGGNAGGGGDAIGAGAAAGGADGEESAEPSPPVARRTRAQSPRKSSGPQEAPVGAGMKGAAAAATVASEHAAAGPGKRSASAQASPGRRAKRNQPAKPPVNAAT
ncbi:unnamed protein product, partial [Phaeothamnion confervicola]